MKLTIILAAVSVVLVAAATAAVVSPTTRANFGVGGIGVGDRLLSRIYIARPPVANAVQSEDAIYRGNATTRITAIYATERGYTQYASAWLVAGGINQTNATVRIQSLVGRGYNYTVEYWGR